MKISRIIVAAFTLLVMMVFSIYNYWLGLEITNSESKQVVYRDPVDSPIENAETAPTVELGTEILNMVDFVPVENQNVQKINNSNYCIFKAGYENCYAIYDLKGKFGKVTFKVQPESFCADDVVEFMVVNVDKNEIIYDTKIKADSIVQSVSVDVSGVNKIEIVAYPKAGFIVQCRVSEFYAHPYEGNIPEVERIPSDGELKRVNLKSLKPYYQYQTYDYKDKSFTAKNRLWDNSIEFYPISLKSTEAEAIYDLNGRYSEFQFTLYHLSTSNKKSTGTLVIKNEETGKVLFKKKIKSKDDVKDINIDVTGVNYLRITFTSHGDSISCLMNDPYLYY